MAFYLTTTRGIRSDSSPKIKTEGEVIIGPNKFVFPEGARDFLPSLYGNLQNISLRVIFPDMAGGVVETQKSLTLFGPGSRVLQVLLTNPKFEPLHVGRTAERDVRRAIVAVLAPLGTWSASLDLALADFVKTPAFGGLTQLSLRDGVNRPGIGVSSIKEGKWYLAEIDTNRIKTAFTCSGSQPVPYPICEMSFEYKEITVKIGFSQEKLHEWRSIRDGFFNYLDSVSVKSN